MNNFRADLHCHTTFSDGTYTPKTLIDLALERGLQGLSITDHDCIDAYDEAFPYAQQLQFPLISGVEFSTICQNTSIHVLAYGFALSSKPIRDLCSFHKERRVQRTEMILHLLAKQNIVLTLQEVLSYFPHSTFPSSIGRPHIAHALIKKGFVSCFEEAFKKYLGNKKPCYVPSTTLSTEETLHRIKEAKGLSVLAHPHLIASAKVLKKLLILPFDGIEGYYARFPKSQCLKWLRIANEKQWIVTGGSDFHGLAKESIPLGSSWTNEETFKLMVSLSKNGRAET